MERRSDVCKKLNVYYSGGRFVDGQDRQLFLFFLNPPQIGVFSIGTHGK